MRDFDFRALAHHVELPLELVFGHLRTTPDEHLLNVRLRITSHAADGRSVNGCITPAEDSEPFFARDALQNSLALQPLLLFHGEKNHTYAVRAGLRQCETERGAFAREKFVRDLDQHTRAVAGFRIAAARAPVRQIDQNLNALENDVVRFLAFDIGYKADAASIALVRRIVKSLRRR